ncbi:cache domain-containing sensor histidine kinase [Neobacillus cucumis]|uniref:histidine kinase n=1 Tax=Neobacillus cucumis TaxID=1740721 RepID=A0A2N5HTR6_9BACI|nr:sensor histidine kinase [Neobacillus cucumis]PLS08903.1 sensor histidine kinase [Neobacillus cucumis]
MDSKRLIKLSFNPSGLEKWRINDFSIRYKLIVLLLLISIVPSIGLSILTSMTVERIIEKQVTENTLQLIGQVNKTLESYANNMQNISYLISFNPEIKSFIDQTQDSKPSGETDSYEMKEFLRNLTTLYPEVAGILVVNSSGKYVSNELYSDSNKNLTQEKWYKQAEENKGIFKILGHPFNRDVKSYVQYKDSDVISVVRAIIDPETQKVKGVVLIDLKLRVIAEATKDARLGKTGYLMVLDERGENIYTPAKKLIKRFPLEWAAGGEAGTFFRQINGSKTQFIYQKSSFTNWTTVGVFPSNEAVSEVKEINFYMISFVFIVCLIGVTASYYLSNSMSRPIGQLMSFMNKAETGDLSVRYRGERKDELGMLGRSFNKMLIQINHLISLTEKQERQKREAELRSLQEHIKPHFLYNTLDTINWMARKQGAEDVADLVGSLSKLFRIGLSRGHDVISLSEEIEHIQSYLQIQKARYKDKLNYTLDVDPHIKNVIIPKLVLQPIVENAIYHGIKERRGPGHILIKAEDWVGDIMIRVTDDGKGISRDKLTVLQENLGTPLSEDEERITLGYGMRNTQARIKFTCGERYGLYIDSEEGKGTTVSILLPRESNDIREKDIKR